MTHPLKGSAYKPQSNEEGSLFLNTFCANCKKQWRDEIGEKHSCHIVDKVKGTDPNYADAYPYEWIYDANGQGRCIEFKDVNDRTRKPCSKTLNLFGEQRSVKSDD